MKQIYKTSVYFNELSKEVFLMKDLKHFGIPQIYDIEEDDIFLYVIEQYIEGESFQSLCVREILKESDVLCYMIKLCDIIGYLHSMDKPILYLDLKPQNIIISGKELYLVDFGSAIYANDSDTSLIFGTPGFAAPEQYENNNLIDERTDIYGIGMLLYYMVTGIIINQDNIKNIDTLGKCSRELKNLINGCLKHKPWMRFTGVYEVKKRMEKLYSKQKKEKNIKKSIIAIAGSQKRAGTTHLAFMLCTYLRCMSDNVIYLEHNSSGFMREFLKNSGNALKPGITHLKAFHVGITNEGSSMFSIKEDDLKRYNYIIKDFGVINENNIDEFIKTEYKILVLGGKEWELTESKKALSLCMNHKDICFMFNFLDAKRFKKVSSELVQKRCYRIPYEPEPIEFKKDSTIIKFFNEALKILGINANITYQKLSI